MGTKAPAHHPTPAAHKTTPKASTHPLEVPEASSGSIKLAYNDCGDATTHGKFTSLSPTTVTLGQKTSLRGEGSLDEAVSGASYTVDAYGPFNLHLFSHSGDACKADTIKLPMGTGSIDFHGFKCPIAKGDVELGLELNLAVSIPASLAKTKIDLKAKSDKGEKALCAEIKTSAAADALIEEYIAMKGQKTTTKAPDHPDHHTPQAPAHHHNTLQTTTPQKLQCTKTQWDEREGRWAGGNGDHNYHGHNEQDCSQGLPAAYQHSTCLPCCEGMHYVGVGCGHWLDEGDGCTVICQADKATELSDRLTPLHHNETEGHKATTDAPHQDDHHLPEASHGSIELAYSDCGDASTHGKLASMSPSTVTLGQKTTLKGKVSLDAAVGGASYTVDAYGPFNVHLFSHFGDACKADTMSGWKRSSRVQRSRRCK